MNEWREWEIFCRVVQAGGFTAAAMSAGIEKSLASSAVARLEIRLGVRLLDRTTRRIRVTEAGQRFYDRLVPVFRSLREIEAEEGSKRRHVGGALKIATPYEVGSQYLSSSLAKLLQEHPSLKVHMDIVAGLPDLIRDGYELAFVATETSLPDSSLAARRVLNIERAFYVAPALIAERGTPAQPADLLTWPAIGAANETGWEFCTGTAEPVSYPVKPRFRTENAEARRRTALHGLGVARLSEGFVQDDVARGDLVRVLPSYASSPVKVYVLMPARKGTSANVQAFLEILETSPGPCQRLNRCGDSRGNARGGRI